MSVGNRRKTIGNPESKFLVYAHIEIVVAFLVVNFFVFLVITRNPGDGEVPG